LDTYPKSGDTPPIPNEGIPPIPNEGIPPIPNQGIPPIPNEGIRREKGREKIREEQEGGKNLPVLDAGKEDPFFSGQHRAIAREVVKVSREISGPRNFITDAPWGKLAEETGKDALGVWREFERYMIALHSDKKDPQVYVGKIATNLYQNPGTEHACKPWVEFAECFRKTLAAPTPRQKPTAPRPKVIEIPDREASARAIREARRA
jgi:hypothetical protein